MDFSNKRKRSMHWTHTKKGILCCTVSISHSMSTTTKCCREQYIFISITQGSDPKCLQIKCNVIPHKSTSRSCQTLNETDHQSCQVSSHTISQSVQVAISKKHIGTQCYCADFSKLKGMSKYVCDKKFWGNFINLLEQHNQLKDFISLTQGLKSGRLNPDNLSWISTLHMGRYSNCPSTTGMRYDQNFMNFTSYIICCLDLVP